ncbi:aldehyde ferredoxin oxidoreductase family protein [Saccharicrinis sp. 156]|uniref:aldehyde ferredoxin oxidoreductase family protein n=1 Tax=Saccharicrinis sp. 156 TaxID=3417574 RepID=UPI003D3343F9
MAFGFRDKILRINLTDSSIKIERPGEDFFKQYIGGTNIIGYFLNKEVGGAVDPLSPENKIIVAPSVITGSPVAGTSRFSVGAKSPLTEGFGKSEAGGFFGPELKFAGWDAIIVEGKAAEPCYICIKDDKVEIKSAKHLWGKDTGPVQEMIREEMGEKKARVLQTGPAGENLVRFAAVCNELKHWNGRGGMGAVFGSKNLRAIAVKGDDREFMKEAVKVKEYAQWFGKNWKNHDSLDGFGKVGTMGLPTILSGMGILPTHNFQMGEFEHAEKIDRITIEKEMEMKREGCFACPVRCKQVVKKESKDPDKNIDPAYGAPEYETLGSIGSNCGIPNAVTVCKGNEMTARFGMDSIGLGMTIAFAMECYEKGIITKEDTDGLELVFGNEEAFLRIIEKIAFRKGFGDILAEGSYRAAQKIGGDAPKYAMTAKKMEFAAHEGRGKWNVALGYAVSPNGGDHVVVEHDHCFMGEPNEDPKALVDGNVFSLFNYGIRKPLEPCSLDHEKVRAFVILQKLWGVMDMLDICIFLAEPSRRMILMEHLPDLVNHVTGWDLSLNELIIAAERSIVMGRLFNAKCGITSKDEGLPERVFTPMTNGAIKGVAIDKKEFEEAKELYYHMAGMDENGAPLKGKLVELRLEELMS